MASRWLLLCTARRSSARWVEGVNRERIDPEGYIVSEADLGNVQPDFEHVPKTAAELLSTFGCWVEQALDHVITGP
jgi:hypothetical protein